MRLARLRGLAWTLVLALLAGPVAPAFASTFGACGRPAPTVGARVRADGALRSHAGPAATERMHPADPAIRPARTPGGHCPGCLTTAGCAFACLGAGLLPASVPVPAHPAATAWDASTPPAPAGVTPSGDLEPPKPVPVR